MKGCGKSAPRTWQQGRHGKPHREQDQIGMTRRFASRFSRPVIRVGCSRTPVTAPIEEWPSRRRKSALQNPAYRSTGAFLRVGAQHVPSRGQGTGFERNASSTLSSVSLSRFDGRAPHPFVSSRRIATKSWNREQSFTGVDKSSSGSGRSTRVLQPAACPIPSC